jgi:hypothetical protein
MMNKMNISKKFLITLSIGLIATTTLFADQKGTEIMQKVYDVATPKYSHSAVEMDLKNSDGDVQKRMLEEWGMEDNDGLASTVMIFRSPSTVKDTRFLQTENGGNSADSKWIYLPALRTVRRIASSDGNKAFMGTDATYDDMETRDVSEDTHSYMSEESFNGYDCYVVDSVAVDMDESQYSHRVSWIDKNSYVPVKIEMYDKADNALLKVMTVNELKNVSGYWIPTADTMENVQTGHVTFIKILQIELDKPLSSRMFTSTFLKTGRA